VTAGPADGPFRPQYREAHLVQSEFIKGEWTDELIYAILRDEWVARQASG
jgi:hypothetical protein